MKEREYQKYLRKCDLRDVEPLPLSPGLRCVAVIPACDELETIGRTLASLVVPDDCAAMVVVNHPEGADSRVKRSSFELLGRLRAGWSPCRNLHWIDAPDLRGGVGEARKLGMDAVVASQRVEVLEQTILASLDADTVAEQAALRLGLWGDLCSLLLLHECGFLAEFAATHSLFSLHSSELNARRW